MNRPGAHRNFSHQQQGGLPSYSKPYRTIDEQIHLLSSRKLIIPDLDQARSTLRALGYQRVVQYLEPFKEVRTVKRNGVINTIRSNVYTPDTNFDYCMWIYDFDRMLKVDLSYALESIEVYIRVAIALYMGKLGPLSYRDSSSFLPSFRDKHQEWLGKIDARAARYKDELYSDFKRRYAHFRMSDVPIWISIESWDFGTVSYCYPHLPDDCRNSISDEFSISPETMESWIRTFNYVRNCCAHYSRVWNHAVVVRPAIEQGHPTCEFFHGSNNKIYTVLGILQYMLERISSHEAFRLRSSVATWARNFHKFPNHPKIGISQAGFPSDWHTKDVWDVDGAGIAPGSI